jgi:hypothetical protein
VLIVAVLIASVVVIARVTTVAAAPSIALVYSTDGGSTWSTTPTVSAGGTVLARV